jgi:hypothetical protein
VVKTKKVAEQQEQTQSEEQKKQSQVYDTSMKDLVDRQAKDILPALLPGLTYQETLNIEVVKPVLRTDKVYLVMYQGKQHILHIEFESGKNKRMGARMLAYNAMLHLEHNLPMISIVIYLFETQMVVSPFLMEGGDGIITTFHFRIIPLFHLKAEKYVNEHIVCMYPLLAAMEGANSQFIKRATDELSEVYHDDPATLGDFFAYMLILLERTGTMTQLEKAKTREALSMYDNLWDQSAIIQQMRAASKEEGKVEGETETLQKVIADTVEVRFPSLLDLAQQKVRTISDPEKLHQLYMQILTAPNEENARALFGGKQDD